MTDSEGRPTPLVAVVVVDGAGNVVAWDRAAQDQLGWQEQDVLGRPLTDVLAVTDGPSLLERETARTRRDEELTHALLYRGRDVSFVVDATGHIAFVPDVADPALGYAAASLLGRPALELVHPDDQELAQRLFDVTVAYDAPQELVGLRCLASDGSWRRVELAVTNLLDNPVVGGLVVNLRDVTERRAMEESLRQSEALYRSIVETAQEGIWLMDDTGRTLFANNSLSLILARPHEQILRLNVFDVVDPDRQAEASRRLQSRRFAGHDVYEMTFVRGDGVPRWASVSASPLFVANDYIGSLLMVSDISDRKRTEAELKRRAMYDDLTGLPNRTLLHDRLGQAMCRRDAAHLVGVFFIDLDHFKAVNDSYGHAAGDEVLRQVADRFQTVVRKDDTLARFAGDEFVVVSADLTGELEAEALAQRMLDVLADPLDVHGHAVELQTSIGISLRRPPGDVEQMILDADIAMYEAKKRGRGRHVMFDARTADSSRYHLEDVQELRTGIERDELEVYYQPQVDMATGVVGSVEALVRWRHPSRGLLQPDDFIDLAEASGLILSLGRRVLEAACRQAAEWAQTLAEPLSVSVNVSAFQLDDETFPDTVRDALLSSELAPGLLVLEITESAVMGDADRAVRVLHELRGQGVHLAIDDFGTGYSSLAHLKRLPIEEIKIDREFVDGVDQPGDDRSIVTAVVSMANALDLRVVAEGVETSDQAQALQDLGCTVAQGYLYGRPMDGERMLASLGHG